MKHAVLGVGAIGGLMATALEFVGEEVTLIVRPEKLSSYPEQLSLQQPDRTITAEAHPVSKLTEAVDVLWIATKTYQLEAALASVIAAPTVVFPLLNGVDHIPVLRARFGNDHVVPATIAVGADRLADGQFLQGSPVRLNLAASGKPLLEDVLRRFHDFLCFICTFIPNEQTLLWTKLSFLAPFALTTSASGLDKGGILADREWKGTLYSAIAEALAVARAEGAEVSQSHIQEILDTSPDTMRSSMLKDLIAGRELELDGIGGPIVRLGDKHHIPVPTARKLIGAIEGKLRARSA
jgi:2-dehydropantoate 2-reductase